MYQFITTNRRYTFSKADIALFVLLILWELAWKGIALYKSARNRQLGWFVVMLIVNTVGILEIVYLIFFQSKRGNSDK